MTETIVAFLLLVCLIFFSSVNMHNILRVHRRKEKVKTYAEIERPVGFLVGLAAVGTMVYFLELLLYLFLVFTGLLSMIEASSFFFNFSLRIHFNVVGLILTFTGCFLFIWSVVVRGRYSVSWEMPEDQKLVTWGPYRYVRHPSYLGYFLMFIGLFFIWPNLFTLLPLLAIPGYYRLTFEEERLLIKRFGEEYLQYQRKTGRFIHKFR